MIIILRTKKKSRGPMSFLSFFFVVIVLRIVPCKSTTVQSIEAENVHPHA